MMRRLLRPFAGFNAQFSRRAILGALARIGVLASAVPAVSAAAEGRPAAELEALAGLIRALVPHAVDEAVYLDAAAAIRGTLKVTPQQIEAGLLKIRDSAGELPGSDPFLAQMRTAAVEALYRDPRVWDLIGYGGNALAKGGFAGTYNDINWLPGAKK